MKAIFCTAALFAVTPAFGQVYQCPDTSGVVRFQQTPCEGGKTVPIKPIPTGAGSGISDAARAYLADRDRYRAEQAKAQAEADKEERRIAAEHHKARATEEQAAAQRATARAIWATGWRRW